MVAEVVANGATTSKQIAEACGAGSDCGRCRRTLRAIIAAHHGGNGTRSDRANGTNGAAPAPALGSTRSGTAG
ncbi:BFD-like [2Fe-2S] binding domain protein [Mycolicibacterium hassiacum DSM 44199]|jgi:bacterioferritin-associated ferredoxin|uniref:BFD-like [2Fe-2S] binding domain protein n=2 Tax=Mycolicibacterium hassiacum TaxID=46351 RepID=K5B9X5_MYCHD|nr:BFD-like [2Fe-2S] binding domain protein [Mycolicibacterium hassiacum DSM 44199]MBX5486263.1 (2Fe-2S)-binding protein [Mycolicibacterium hassiacum]PZN23430.1 MAG: (2Fe-2S)-binding protein [Mycolicibacterium hassiacum]VCT90150.1 hypothetical protein MHAS_01854 [Mycolicibacterium hassiacum DSM 44199]